MKYSYDYFPSELSKCAISPLQLKYHWLTLQQIFSFMIHYSAEHLPDQKRRPFPDNFIAGEKNQTTNYCSNNKVLFPFCKYLRL
jgi:hypothetical protein